MPGPHPRGVGGEAGGSAAGGRAARDVLSALFVRIALRVVAAVCVDVWPKAKRAKIRGSAGASLGGDKVPQ